MRIAWMLPFIAVTLGCSPSETPDGLDDQRGPSMANTTAVDVESALSGSSLVFHSWGGKWKGTDIDTQLTLYADGTAMLSHYGTSDDHVEATWSAKGNEMMLYADFDKLVEMPGALDWPKLQLRQRDGRLFLLPTRETKCLQYEQGTGWPLGEVEN